MNSSAFPPAERARIVGYWNQPGRYEIGVRVPDATSGGPFAVRLTPEASVWFHKFNRQIRPGKLPPGQNPSVTAQSRPWEDWIAAKLKFDRAKAQRDADAANAQLATSTAAADATQSANSAQALPPHPGPMPADLLAAIGNAPPFATSVAPQRYTIRFESGETIVYTDHISPSNPRYAYFRFAQGVASGGTSLAKMPAEELNRVFDASGFTPTEARVMRAISLLEGGFDSINTYDTGFLSIGFIQFAALEGGSGSVGDLMKYHKNRNAQDYARDFRQFGIDVTEDGVLVVVDPSTGVELRGNEAVLKIIDDKRLTAAFHLAGMRSTTFRAAQIQIAKSRYYPADLPVSVTIKGQALNGRVSDVIRSEAGLATLFDRKVNTGNIRLLDQVLQEVMEKHRLSRLEEVLPFEREIIAAVKWRRDFLKDATLSQPA